MQTYIVEEIKYYSFDSLPVREVTHAVFTRLGGVSSQPWDSLNVGASVGDDPIKVAENRSRIFQAFRRPMESMYDVYQVHSSEIILTRSPRDLRAPYDQADAIITDSPEVTLFMRFADCLPILLYDPVKYVVGLVHAGWKGTLNRIAALSIEKMVNNFGSRPENILACIGPSISAHHYPVGEEIADQVQETFNDDANKMLIIADDRIAFDLWYANQLILEQVGVKKLENPHICTACNTGEWYSHRGENGKTGRFGVLVGLAPHHKE